MPRTLFWGSGSTPAWRVQIALAEKQLPYDSKLIEFSKSEHKGPAITALNPRGQVPTFVDDDGTVVNESLAAVLYLDRRYPDAGSGPLIPADPKAAGLVLQRLMEAGVLHAAISAVIYPKMRGELGSDEAVAAWKQKAAALKAELGQWEAHVKGSGGEWIAGNEFTAADVAAAPFVLALKRFGASLADFPALAAYADRLAARPSVAETWPPHWKESEGPGWLKDAGL